MTDQFIQSPRETQDNADGHKLLELLQLINEELTAGLRVEGDAPLAHGSNEAREDIGLHICFKLADRELAIPLSAVLEAGELQVLQALPLLPDWLSGITNIRGEIISVVDLALFLDWKSNSSATAPSFLVVHDDTIKLAITIDHIVGTHSLYRPFTEQTEQKVERSLPTGFFAGKAVYEEQDTEKTIDLFDLDTFLSSKKLRDIATV